MVRRSGRTPFPSQPASSKLLAGIQFGETTRFGESSPRVLKFATMNVSLSLETIKKKGGDMDTKQTVWTSWRTGLSLIAFAAAACMLGNSVWAQEGEEADDASESEEADPDALEEITVVGSRVRGRSETDSPVPVDVIDGEDFRRQGTSDLDSLVATLVPSYNVSAEPISDAATIMRPANLRGLSPDATLVLVNGKRRHRGAVIALLGSGVSAGSQAPDLASIPGIAIERLEVLRDGASAQYGSDAIAGIMNFVLKGKNAERMFEFKTGSTFEADGGEYTLAANFPAPMGDNGWLNISMEYREAGPTDRAVQRSDAQDLIDAGNEFVRTPHAMVWGTPEVRDDFKLFANAGVELSDESEWYGWGSRSVRSVEGGFFFRNPNTRNGVFNGPSDLHFDPGSGVVVPSGTPGARSWDETVKVANLNAALGGCGPGTVWNPNTGAAFAEQNDSANYASIIRDLPDHCFMWQERQPGGFTPQFGGDVLDQSIGTGFRGTLENGWFWDASIVHGTSEAAYFINNTVNPQIWSLIYVQGGDPVTTPVDYKPGSYAEADTVLNAEVSKPLDVASFYGDLNVAAGIEYRRETFTIMQGGVNSWFIDNRERGLAAQGFGIGSNGFAGFPASDAGENSIAAGAMYLDVEGDFTEAVKLGGALRYENYDLYGTTVDGKVTGRMEISDDMAIRGAFSTGFRVPTGGQANLRNVTTEFTDGKLADIATLPPTNPVAIQKGAQELIPETSTNLTLGLAWSLDQADITFDFYSIQIKDRIAFTSRFALTAQDIEDLLEAGVEDATSFSSVRYFSNQQDLDTVGMDLVVSYPFSLMGGNSNLTVAANWNSAELTRYNPNFTSEHLKMSIEQGRPSDRLSATLFHAIEDWSGFARVRRYGEHYDATLNSAGVSFVTEPTTILDFEVGYDVSESMTLHFGMENMFDIYPSENPNGPVDSRGAGGASGLIYPEQAPFGFNGGFWYFRFTWGG